MNTGALVDFLQELASNNHKAWFDAHRAQYQALRQAFTDLVAEVLAGIGAVDPAVRDLQAANCLFRIHRDVRFARDKSPYKTQFSAAIGAQGRSTNLPAYYFQIDAAGTLFLGGGLYAPSPSQLAHARRFIGAHPERLDALYADRAFHAAYGAIDGERLKRPPAGFPADAPHLEALKLKQYLVGQSNAVHELAQEAVAPLIPARFSAAAPFIFWLREAVGAPAGSAPESNGPDPLPVSIF